MKKQPEKLTVQMKNPPVIKKFFIDEDICILHQIINFDEIFQKRKQEPQV